MPYSGIVRRAESALPGGVLGRHAYPDAVEHVPVSGRGAWIVDHAGREYLDYSCGGGSLILGYSHPAVVRAVREQAGLATQFVSVLNLPALRLAERVKELVGWVDLVRLALSGAEAVMFSLRLARVSPPRINSGAGLRPARFLAASGGSGSEDPRTQRSASSPQSRANQ